MLGYLSSDEARAVVDTAGRLSAPGSRFGAGQFPVDASQSHYQELRRLAFGSGADHPPVRGLGADADAFLRERGWSVEFRSWDDLVAPLGRPVATGDPANGFVLAERR